MSPMLIITTWPFAVVGHPLKGLMEQWKMGVHV